LSSNGFGFPIPSHSGQIFASGFKAAGVGAQHNSAAAAAFLLQDSEYEWTHIDLCWVGPFAHSTAYF